MDIIEDIKINNNKYKIYFVEADDERLLIEDGKYHSGVTDFYKKEIYINMELKCDALRYTVLHELTHSLIDSYGFMQVDWNDEIVADFVANNLPTILDIMKRISKKILKKQKKIFNNYFGNFND